MTQSFAKNQKETPPPIAVGTKITHHGNQMVRIRPMIAPTTAPGAAKTQTPRATENMWTDAYYLLEE